MNLEEKKKELTSLGKGKKDVTIRRQKREIYNSEKVWASMGGWGGHLTRISH